MKRIPLFACVFPLFFLLGSCLGISMDISLNQNGSGTIALEYQISKSLDSLGKLDGNERWNTIPVGKADFERSIDRLPDMKLVSFSSREDKQNVTITAKMEFSSIQGLLAFLDASGRHSSFSGEAPSGRLLLTLADGAERKNPDLDKLIADISESYHIKMSMSFPGEGNLAVFNSQNALHSAIPGSEIKAQGKKVSCSFPLNEVLCSSDGIKVEFRW